MHLVLAHPGHELRIFGLLEKFKPVTHLLTQGSRSSTFSRITHSNHLLSEVGATPGDLWGAIDDRGFYQKVMTREIEPFHRWIDTLRDSFVTSARHMPLYVVIDGFQFYNVAHDLTHLMARIAILEARALGADICCMTFETVPSDWGASAKYLRVATQLRLSDREFAVKLAWIDKMPDLAEEALNIIAHEGVASLQTEILFHPPELDFILARPDFVTPYEIFGHQRVTQGLYKTVLTTQHVSQIVDLLLPRADTARINEASTPVTV